MKESRTYNSMRNTILALSEQLLYNILSFICRTVFIWTLGKTYLGFSGLFGDILTVLSLGELGVGTAITYSMYKPTAEKDYEKVTGLLNEYKKLYTIIGVGISIIGLLLTPFLYVFISGIPDMPEVPYIYILYLLNTTGSYFFIYKKSILITQQKSYVASIIFIITVTIQNILQIVTLLVFHNFIIYLILQLLSTLVNNISISVYVDKKYKFIREYKNARIDQSTRKILFKNVWAMFASKLSSAIVSSTSNILISTFVSTITLGLYSNYTLFTNMIRTIVSKIFEAMIGSIGDLVATSSSEKIYWNFRGIWFINFWLVSFCSITFCVLANPFIQLWIGNDYLIEEGVVILLCVNLYMRLMRNTFLSFQDSYGLFLELRVKCIAEAIINLSVSLFFLLVLKLGIYGILLGTFVSNITTSFWYEPYLLFVTKFHKSWLEYFKLFSMYAFITAVTGGLEYYICNIVILGNGLGWFILRLIICIVSINCIYLITFHRMMEFSFLKEKLQNIFKYEKDRVQ